jgi:hypothetical protein
MSLHTYTRPGVDAVSLPRDAPLFIVGHGAGSAHWRDHHPITQLALSYAPVVYSFQLPLHGEDARREMPQPFDTHEQKQQLVRDTLEAVYTLLASIVRHRYVVFIGYSTSQYTSRTLRRQTWCTRMVPRSHVV